MPVRFDDIRDGIEVVESFLLSKYREQGRVSCIFCLGLEKIALLFLERYFFPELPVFPVSGEFLETILRLSHQVHIVWRVH